MNENNEIMTNVAEVEEVNSVTDDNERSGLGTGAAIGLGAVLALAGIAGFKKVKKIVEAKKAKKEAASYAEVVDFQPEEDSDDEE